VILNISENIDNSKMSKLKELSESWRNLVLQRLKKGKVEGWKRRLFGQRKRESSKLDNKN
jgi:hypothetical protein